MARCVQNNVAGAQCDQCKPGSFHLTEGNAEGCLQCFCMGVTKECASSSWSRDQVGLLPSLPCRSVAIERCYSICKEGYTVDFSLIYQVLSLRYRNIDGDLQVYRFMYRYTGIQLYNYALTDIKI